MHMCVQFAQSMHDKLTSHSTCFSLILSTCVTQVLSNIASSPGPNFSRKIFATMDARRIERNAKIRHASVVANILRENFGPGDEAISNSA